MADRRRKTVDIFVDRRYSPAERKAIGDIAIEYIKQRTAKGHGKGNKPFSQNFGYKGNRDNSRTYADSYRRTQEFAIAGKSPRPINLKLTGDMLDSLETVDVSLAGRVRIGYSEAGNESDKAWYNEEKGYNFLELSEDEVNKIVKQAGVRLRQETRDISTEVAQEIARRLFGRDE